MPTAQLAAVGWVPVAQVQHPPTSGGSRRRGPINCSALGPKITVSGPSWASRDLGIVLLLLLAATVSSWHKGRSHNWKLLLGGDMPHLQAYNHHHSQEASAFHHALCIQPWWSSRCPSATHYRTQVHGSGE